MAILLCLFFSEAGWILNQKFSKTKISSISVGFIAVLAVFQVIALLFMRFEVKFTYLYALCLILIGTMTIYVLLNMRQSKMYGISYMFNGKKEKFKREILIWVIALGTIMVQIVGYIVLQHLDADDSFFVAEISTILQTNYINKIDCTTGIQNYIFDPQYKLVGWEVFLSVFCKFFGINAAAFCHTCLPLVLVVIHYFIIWDISKELHNNKPFIPFTLMSILNIFGNYSVYTRESFLLFRIWQGKAVYVNIVLPMMLLLMLKIFKVSKNIKNEYIVLLTFTLFAGINATTVGIYLGPLAYAIYVLTYTLYSKNIRNFVKLCIPVVCVLPNVIMKLLYLLRFSTIEEASVGADSFNWMSWLLLVTGNKWYLTVVFASMICLILIKGNKIEKYLFAIYPILCILTFLNPLFAKFVSGHITGVSVYWRLFWNLQISFIVVDAILIASKVVKYKIVILLALVSIIVCQNGFIYTRENFEWAKNVENVNETSYDIVMNIKEITDDNIVLLAPEEYTYDIRQMTGKIELAWSRYVHPDNLLEIYARLYSEKCVTQEDIYKLKEIGINYLALYASTDTSNIYQKQKNILCDDENIILIKL